MTPLIHLLVGLAAAGGALYDDLKKQKYYGVGGGGGNFDLRDAGGRGGVFRPDRTPFDAYIDLGFAAQEQQQKKAAEEEEARRKEQSVRDQTLLASLKDAPANNLAREAEAAAESRLFWADKSGPVSYALADDGGFSQNYLEDERNNRTVPYPSWYEQMQTSIGA